MLIAGIASIILNCSETFSTNSDEEGQNQDEVNGKGRKEVGSHFDTITNECKILSFFIYSRQRRGTMKISFSRKLCTCACCTKIVEGHFAHLKSVVEHAVCSKQKTEK